MGKELTSHPLCIYLVPMSASSNALEASITLFSASKEGDVALSPSTPQAKERITSRQFFPGVKCPALPASCMKSHSISASRDNLEASIDLFLLAEEGTAALLPSAPQTKEKITSKYFFPIESAQLRLPVAWSNVPFALLATIWKHQSTRFYLQRRATLPYRCTFSLPQRHRWSKGGGSFW